MNHRTRFGTILLAGASLIPGTTVCAMAQAIPAQSVATNPPPATDPVLQIPQTLKSLDEAKAGKYGELRRTDRQRLETAKREISALQAHSPDLTQLDAGEKVRLFNAQESILSIVTGLKSSEMVCTYTTRAGTRFKSKHCTTRDMADAARRAARESTDTAQRDLCVPGETSTC